MFGFLDARPVTVSWPLWFQYQPRLHIFSTLQYSGSDAMVFKGQPIVFRQAIDGLQALVGSGRLAVPIGTTCQGIERLRDALCTMGSNSGDGKIVVTF
jgi:hypothetical protein